MDELKRRVELYFEPPISYAEVAPILDELGHRFRVVESRRIDARGLAVGGPGTHAALELLIDMGQIVIALMVKDLISELSKDIYKGVRSAILDAFEKRGEQPSFALTIGSLKLQIESPMTDVELVEALHAARALAESLPDEQVADPRGTMGARYEWEPSSKTWRGPIVP